MQNRTKTNYNQQRNVITLCITNAYDDDRLLALTASIGIYIRNKESLDETTDKNLKNSLAVK